MYTIQSFWHITYGGAQHGVILKKLEHLAGFKAIDPIVEKLRWEGQAIAHVSFFVAYAARDWQAAQHALLNLAWKTHAYLENHTLRHISQRGVLARCSGA